MEDCKHELREIFPSDGQLPLKENLKDEEMQQEGKYNGFQVHLGKKNTGASVRILVICHCTNCA